MWRESWKLSLEEVMVLTHQEAELQWREELLYLAGRRRVCDALCSGTDVCLLPFFRAAVLGGQHKALLETLDNSELRFLSGKNTFISQPWWLKLPGEHVFGSFKQLFHVFCSKFRLPFSRSRIWRAGGGVRGRVVLGCSLLHLYCRCAGEHGGG